jgi:hypothetical protein
LFTYSIGYWELYRHFQEGFFFLVGGGAGGGGYLGESFRGGCFLGVRDISMKGAPDFPALFKKRSEIKFKKNKFFQLKVRSNIRT